MNWKDKLYYFKIENWRGKLLWIFHPTDSYEQHNKRYYNLKSVKKVVKLIYENK